MPRPTRVQCSATLKSSTVLSLLPAPYSNTRLCVEPERRGAQVDRVVLIHTFYVDVVALERLVDKEHMLEARLL